MSEDDKTGGPPPPLPLDASERAHDEQPVASKAPPQPPEVPPPSSVAEYQCGRLLVDFLASLKNQAARYRQNGSDEKADAIEVVASALDLLMRRDPLVAGLADWLDAKTQDAIKAQKAMESVGMGNSERKVDVATDAQQAPGPRIYVVPQRQETTYLNLIGAMLSLMLSRTPAGKAQSVFETQDAIVTAITTHFPDQPGLSKRTIDEKFAAAKRSISDH